MRDGRGPHPTAPSPRCSEGEPQKPGRVRASGVLGPNLRSAPGLAVGRYWRLPCASRTIPGPPTRSRPAPAACQPVGGVGLATGAEPSAWGLPGGAAPAIPLPRAAISKDSVRSTTFPGAGPSERGRGGHPERGRLSTSSPSQSAVDFGSGLLPNCSRTVQDISIQTAGCDPEARVASAGPPGCGRLQPRRCCRARRSSCYVPAPHSPAIALGRGWDRAGIALARS